VLQITFPSAFTHKKHNSTFFNFSEIWLKRFQPPHVKSTTVERPSMYCSSTVLFSFSQHFDMYMIILQTDTSNVLQY